MVAHALEPSGDGGLGVTSEADHDGDVDPFGHQPEHHLDAVGRGLEIVERRVASAGEIRSAPLAAEMLDVSLDAAFAVADEGMDLIISDRAGYLAHPPVIQSGSSLIMMMQATQYRKSDDLAGSRWIIRRNRDSLRQSLMRPTLVVVLDVVASDDVEMLLVEHKHVVETFSA